jgi:predicted AlkP superfamily phosphohydrolase/phosphomutase
VRRVLGALVAIALLGGCAPAAPRTPAVVVIGIDGLDPDLLREAIARGRMPHFESLMKSGSFRTLETSIPPQSPVAWSNFITGMDPGGHGIFDFIHRDPATYLPVFSTALVSEPERTLKIGDWVIPLSAGHTRLLRKGEAFWQILGRHGIPYTIVRVPANFPPAPGPGRALAGMGTPDLAGGYGTFSFYTDDPSFTDGPVAGGVIHRVIISENQVSAELAGPENTLRADHPSMTAPFHVDLDPGGEAVRIAVASRTLLLAPRQWSEWVNVRFAPLGPFRKVSGICRFYLESVRPFKLYVTPINIDPVHPALPISTPPGFGRWLAERIGDFYTQGIAEDTKALRAGVFDDAAFVGQTDHVLGEEWRLLGAALDSYRGGFLFFYVSTVDQSCHMLWRNRDPMHPAHATSPGFADRIDSLYAGMDSLLGVVESRIPRDATLLVMSDHGFAPFYKRVNLNAWLQREGYLSVSQPGIAGQGSLFDNVLWRRTRAYALGLNGLYLNVMHREGKGIVRRGAEYDTLLDELTTKLLALRDPETGTAIVTRVDRPRDVYHGTESANAPDLIVGYNRGYRSSDESALGTVTSEWLEPNTDKWSGDHCMDHTLVPGVLLSNRALAVQDPSLLDVPVTILAEFGIARPAPMRGRALFTP